MADVLLVHVREDDTLADSIGISLERSGLTVARGESVFDVGDEVPCVVVLWSDVSTRSSMVRDVAIRAQREGKLVGATLGGCETPLGFSRPAPFDLSEWGGDPDDPTLDALFFAADRLVCAAKLGGAPRNARPSQPYVQRPAARATPVSLRGELPAEEDDLRYRARQETRELPEAPLPRAAQRSAPEDAGKGHLPPNLAVETLAWKQIEHSKNPQDFLDYLSHYGPQGMFSELASMKLDKLTPGQKSATPMKAFMAHRPSPHIERKARPAPRPSPANAPPSSTAARREEMRSEVRVEPRLSEIRRPPPAPEAISARANIAARRRAAGPPQIATRRTMQAENNGFPWRPMLFLVALGAGGFAVYQNLPKVLSHHSVSAQQTLNDELAAAAPDNLNPTESDAASPAPSAPLSDPDPDLGMHQEPGPSKKTPVKLAENTARPKHTEGVGGPIISMAPRDTGGGGRTAAPPPVVSFHPATSAPAPAPAAPVVAPPAVTAPALQPAPVAPVYDPALVNRTRYVQAHWVSQPSGERLNDLYPDNAASRGLGGSVSLDCAILQSGRLDCVIVSENPAGHGFGKAALTASRAYMAAPQASDGSTAYGARTRLTISFR